MKAYMLAVCVALAGCATSSPFDNVLYNQAVDLSVSVDAYTCNAPDTSVATKSRALLRYTENRAQDLHPVFMIIDNDIAKLVEPNHSQAYCEAMVKLVGKEFANVLAVIGRKK